VLQIVFTVLLVGVLIAAVVSFVIMGLMQIRRTRAVTREAYGLGLRFSPRDPFDVPRRYAHFSLISSGHGPRASNVAHGRIAGRSVRAFDFRCEAGHGTHRVTRYYNVIVIETDPTLPELVMWNDNDPHPAPLGSLSRTTRIGYWNCSGDGELARSLSEVFENLGPEGTSFESRGACLMIFTPVRHRGPGGAGRVGDIIARIPDLPAPLGTEDG